MSFDRVSKYWPEVLSIARIVIGLLFLEHGMNKMFHYPLAGGAVVHAYNLMAFPVGPAGVIEVVGGVLIAVGLYTRVAALAAAAEIAMAYGALDRPDTTILFGVIFFYLVFAGPGLWSLDGRIHQGIRNRARQG